MKIRLYLKVCVFPTSDSTSMSVLKPSSSSSSSIRTSRAVQSNLHPQKSLSIHTRGAASSPVSTSVWWPPPSEAAVHSQEVLGWTPCCSFKMPQASPGIASCPARGTHSQRFSGFCCPHPFCHLLLMWFPSLWWREKTVLTQPFQRMLFDCASCSKFSLPRCGRIRRA